MASNYTFAGSTLTTEQAPGGPTVPVQEFGYYSQPSNIYFQFRRPTSQLQALSQSDRTALIASVADQLATRIEDVAALPQVETLAYSQPANAAGQLLDIFTVYVSSSSGLSDGQVTIPLANIGPGDYTTSRINAEVSALDADENA